MSNFQNAISAAALCLIASLSSAIAKQSRTCIALLFIVYCSLSIASAQSVGFVMSGGGAKCMVHLGVLKALEENEIPIDYITGTSMGAVLGSMYVSGYSVEEIAAYIESPEFKRWQVDGDFTDEIPAFYKQMVIDAEIGSIKLHIRPKTPVTMALPTNLVLPYKMDIEFLKLYTQATAVCGHDLNKLMLPFRAVSTNVYDKQQYAPRYGDLAMLVRASMSFPGVFKPTLIDSILLFDGGIINNFPIDLMEDEFAPDVIIGSNCSYNYERPTEDNVLSHIYALVSANSRYEIPVEKGWLLNFDSLQNVDLLAFELIRPLMQTGYNMAMQMMPQIKEGIKRRKTQQELAAQRADFRAKMPPLVFKQINMQGGTRSLRTYVKSRMTRHSDTLMSLPKLRKRYFDIVTDDGLTTFVPQAQYNEQDSAFDLGLRISPAPNVKIGAGGYFSSGPIQAFINAAYTYYAPLTLRFYANGYLGSVYTSQTAMLRGDYRIRRWDFPIFLELGETYNGFDYYTRNPEIVFSDQRPDFLQDDEIFGFVNLGTGTVGNSALRLNFSGGRRNERYYQTQDFTSVDIPEKMTFKFMRGGLFIENNSLNFKTNPTKGLRQFISASYIYGDEYHTYGTMSDIYKNKIDTTYAVHYQSTQRMWRFKAQRTQYFQPSQYFSIGYHVEGVYSQPIHLIDYYPNLLMLPAFEPLQHTNGLFLENFRSSVYVAGGIIPTYTNVFGLPNLLLRSELYAFFPFAELSKDNIQQSITPRYRNELRNIYFVGNVAAIYQFPFANVSFSVSYYDRPNIVYKNFFFAFNLGYYLNNRRAFE
jgi:NTE family protein